MNIKTLILALLIATSIQSCSNRNTDDSNSKPIASDAGGKKYTLFLYQDNYDDPSGKITLDSTATPLTADNDTIAYLTALKKFYNQKVVERKNAHFGQPRSFMITDKNGIDLKIILPVNLIQGLKTQVENIPDVRNMIEEYKRDSL